MCNTASISLTSQVTGVLPIANGGTNATSQTTNGLNYFNGTSITSGNGFVYSGGNVGIGTASPGVPLDLYTANNSALTASTIRIVNGSSTVTTGNNPGIQIADYIGSASGTTNEINFLSSRGAISSLLPTASGDYLYSIYGTGQTTSGGSSTNWVSGSLIASVAEGTFTSSSAPAALTFSTSASGTTTPSERLRINNAGNVGIGTTEFELSFIHFYDKRCHGAIHQQQFRDSLV